MKQFLFISVFALLFVFTAHTQAAADIYKALGDVEKYFSGLEGIVIDEKGIIDLGRDKSLAVGTLLTVFSEGEKVVHPVTGKILGQKKKVAGQLIVTEVENEFSYVKFEGVKPKVKDAVGILLPVKISIEGEVSADIKNAFDHILKANTVMIAGDDYKLDIKETGKGLVYSVVQNDGTVIFSGTGQSYAPVAKAEAALENVGIYPLTSDRFYSMAMGKIYKGNDNLFMVASTEKGVYIFDPRNDFKLVEQIKHKFYTVANIEVADLDEDGVDEIFVSHVVDGKVASSLIFKHTGSSFVPIESDISYIFRSVLSGGKRKILVQQILYTGGYKGEIFNYEYSKGKYIVGDAIRGSIGKQLFGFSYFSGKSGGDLQLININKNNNVEISTIKRNEFVSSKYYGDTIHKIVGVTSEIRAASHPSEKDEFASIEKSMSVYPRIEILFDEYPVLVQNNVKSRLFTESLVFENSVISINSFQFNTFKEVLTTDEFMPITSDIFVYTDNGVTYIAVLRCNNNWIFQSAESDVRILKLNKTNFN